MLPMPSQSPHDSNAIMVSGLSFFYGKHAILTDVTFSLGEKGFIGLIGPNGAGKSTLLKILLGILHPSSGEVNIFGKDPREVRECIGYVPQHTVVDPWFPITSKEVVLTGILSRKKVLRRISSKEKSQVLRSLALTNMTKFANTQIHTLSGGERQRVLLARALVGERKILLLDEPLTGVDPPSATELYRFLKDLSERMLIILVSHDVGVVSSYVDKIFCINKTVHTHESVEDSLSNLEKVYGCPVDLIAHGVPHRVLRNHTDDNS